MKFRCMQIYVTSSCSLEFLPSNTITSFVCTYISKCFKKYYAIFIHKIRTKCNDVQIYICMQCTHFPPFISVQKMYKIKQKEPLNKAKTTKLQMLQTRFDWVYSWTVVESASHPPCTGLSRIQYLNMVNFKF